MQERAEAGEREGKGEGKDEESAGRGGRAVSEASKAPSSTFGKRAEAQKVSGQGEAPGQGGSQ